MQERGKIIWKFAELIEQHADELAKLETLDNGKPYSISRGVDVPHVVKHFQYFAGQGTLQPARALCRVTKHG